MPKTPFSATDITVKFRVGTSDAKQVSKDLARFLERADEPVVNIEITNTPVDPKDLAPHEEVLLSGSDFDDSEFGYDEDA